MIMQNTAREREGIWAGYDPERVRQTLRLLGAFSSVPKRTSWSVSWRQRGPKRTVRPGPAR